MNKIIAAAQFAKEKHKSQVRKYNNKPYITHPARVASRVMLFDDVLESEVCAAWLHDVVEDCGVEIAEIDELFGSFTAKIVLELTNPSKGVKASRAVRKQMDRDHLKEVSFSAKRIKLVDRLDNCLELGGAHSDFIGVYITETKALLSVIGNAVPELQEEILEQLKNLERSIDY